MVLFIGNLSKLTTESELKDLLRPFGALTRLKLMKDRVTARSRGYAYADVEQDIGVKILAKLNTTSFMGQMLIIGVATQKQLSSDWD